MEFEKERYPWQGASEARMAPCFYCGLMTMFVCGSCEGGRAVCMRCYTPHERRSHADGHVKANERSEGENA